MWNKQATGIDNMTDENEVRWGYNKGSGEVIAVKA